MRRISLILMIAAILFPVSMSAGIHGILKGKVVDKNGEGLIGATVQVLGTTRGTMVSDPDGKYTIVNIVAGKYQIKFSMVGYGEVIRNVSISADQTTEINVTLQSSDVQMDEVVVTGNRELVNKTDIGKIQSYDSETITQAARTTVDGVVNLSAGVTGTGNGFIIRGSRSNDTQIRVDGMDISNQFVGGYGPSGSAYFPMISSYAVSEVQVLTGGFSAEYGDAMGGVVNSVAQTGRTDRYEGFLRWTTDVQPLFGSQSSGLDVINNGNEFVPVQRGDGAKRLGDNEHRLEFGTGGRIPFTDKSTYFLTGNYKYKKYSGSSYEIYDPAGNNWGHNDNDESWVKYFGSRFNFAITNDISMLVGLDWGLTNREFDSQTWEYIDMNGTLPGQEDVPYYIAKLPVQNISRTQLFAKINHTLTDKMFYEILVSNTSNTDETSKRADLDNLNPNFFTGFELLEPHDDYRVLGSDMVEGSDNIMDEFTFLTNPQLYSEDGYLRGDFAAINPLTGYVEGDQNVSGTNNPWGLKNFFTTYGNATGLNFRYSNYWQVKGDLTSLFVTGEFSHTFKTGFDVRLFEMERFSVSNPESGNPFRDIYTDRFGGNIYIGSETGYERTSNPVNPYKLALYVQDQIEYKDIIFSPGLRFDYFNPNNLYRAGENNVEGFISIEDEEGFADADAKFQVSPRINVSYPITDVSVLSINYGMYFKMPPLQYMYDGFGIDRIRPGASVLGDPNLNAERTNAYQVDYNQQINSTMRFSVSAYYKDIYDQNGVKYVPVTPDPYFQYTNADYGNSKGIEFEFFKRPAGDHIGLQLNYTLSQVTGTSQSPASNYNVPLDPFTDLPMFPLATYPMGWDIRHNIKGTLRFIWGDNEGPSIGGIYLLQNTLLAFTGSYRTGTPYTKTDPSGNRLSDINTMRNPDLWTLDMQLSKVVRFSDIFGESAGNTQIELFANVYNLLNRTAAVALNSATSDPIDNGVWLQREIGTFANQVFYKEADYKNPETFNRLQYDDLGNRLYNEYADYDGNGIVTQREQYTSYINYVEHVLKFQGNFQAPRSVYMGVMFRF